MGHDVFLKKKIHFFPGSFSEGISGSEIALELNLQEVEGLSLIIFDYTYLTSCLCRIWATILSTEIEVVVASFLFWVHL